MIDRHLSMSAAPTLTSPWEQGDALARPLVAAARALTANDAGGRSAPLVVVVRPGSSDQAVVGAGGNNALRAAVSVAAAAENSRLWQGAPSGETVERPVRGLPEVVRAAAEGAGISHVHVGTVERDDRVACAALWFATPEASPDLGTRRSALALLDAAVDKDDTAAAAAAAAPAPAERRDADPLELHVGSDDPAYDALTGLASRQQFDDLIADFEGDEASMVLIDLDGFVHIVDEHGADTGEAVLREVAQRLVSNCRGNDLVARLQDDRFVVVVADADRSTALRVAKRLLGAVAEPLPAGLGPDSITATIAMAHQMGMVDMEELQESAEDAVASGKRAGRARVVVAS